MVVLGVVLVLLALAVAILLVAGVASLDGTIDVSVPGGTLSFPPLTFLITGMVVISVFWLGWVVLRTGVRRSRRRRAEAKEAAREAEAKRAAEEQRLKEEFAARERQLIEERRRHDSETAELKRGTGEIGAAGAPGHSDTDPDASDSTRTDDGTTREPVSQEAGAGTEEDTTTVDDTPAAAKDPAGAPGSASDPDADGSSTTSTGSTEGDGEGDERDAGSPRRTTSS